MPTSTPLGTANAGVIATVDDGAALHLAEQPWSVQWWVGAEDRWHRPASAASLRQSLIESSPIVESRLRVPGGDVITRAGAFQGGETAMVALEVENDSAVPVVLALVIEGAEEVRVESDTVSIDGQPAWRTSTPPKQVAAAADVEAAIVAGEAAPLDDGVLVPNPDRDRQVAILFPLTHTAVLGTVFLRGGEFPSQVPTAATLGAGWTTQTDRGMRLATPDERWGQAFEACRRRRGFAAGTGTGAEADADPVGRALLVAALGTAGLHSEARAHVLALLGVHDERRGALAVEADDPHAALATAAAAWALSHHLELAPDPEFRTAAVPPLAGALQFLADRRVRGLRSRGATRGLVDGALVPSLWSLAAWRDGARVLAAAGELAAATTARRFVEHTGPAVRSALGDATAAETELATSLLQLVAVEAGAPDPAVAVEARLAAASGTWTWDDDGDVETGPGGGAAIAGAADLVHRIRNVVVREHDHGLDLLPGYPEHWLGQAVEVHDAPTRVGTLSFALRWHDARPALLWEFEPYDPEVAVVLRAPALDPAWSSNEPSGEALLAPPPGPAPGDSFS